MSYARAGHQRGEGEREDCEPANRFRKKIQSPNWTLSHSSSRVRIRGWNCRDLLRAGQKWRSGEGEGGGERVKSWSGRDREGGGKTTGEGGEPWPDLLIWIRTSFNMFGLVEGDFADKYVALFNSVASNVYIILLAYSWRRKNTNMCIIIIFISLLSLSYHHHHYRYQYHCYG